MTISLARRTLGLSFRLTSVLTLTSLADRVALTVQTLTTPTPTTSAHNKNSPVDLIRNRLMTERDFAIDVVQRLQYAGFQALWAGGCVRDELLGLTPADYDIATDATPEQVKQQFKRCLEFGASFGVMEVLGPRDAQGEWLKVQVTTFRSDGTYSDERRPDSVTFSSPREDAERRDFTINGMFQNPITGEVIDYVGGEADLKAKILRAIGEPEKRFEEDKLRILRAVRMAARFELAIDRRTADAARAMAHRISVVSAERIAEELRKILVHPNRLWGVRLLQELNLVEQILPEIVERIDDAFAAVDRLTKNCMFRVSFPLAFATILHPVRGAAPGICERLRLSNVEKDRVGWLLASEQMLRDADALQPSKLYPLLAHPGSQELIQLHNAWRGTYETLRHCVTLLATKSPEELNPPPLLTGNDLQTLGLKPGPRFKLILDAVRAGQLDGQLRSSEEAATFAKNWQPA